MRTPLRLGASDRRHTTRVVDRRQPRRRDLRARAGTASLLPTVQLRFDLPRPEATALAAGVWLHEADDGVASLGASLIVTPGDLTTSSVAVAGRQ